MPRHPGPASRSLSQSPSLGIRVLDWLGTRTPPRRVEIFNGLLLHESNLFSGPQPRVGQTLPEKHRWVCSTVFHTLNLRRLAELGKREEMLSQETAARHHAQSPAAKQMQGCERKPQADAHHAASRHKTRRFERTREWTCNMQHAPTSTTSAHASITTPLTQPPWAGRRHDRHT
jgi:hypothetical protein